MLEFIRSRSKSIAVQVLFGLLILSFVAWGVGDFVNSSSQGTAIAKVGELEIDPLQFDYEYRREIENMRNILGGNFTNEQAKLMGIGPSVLERLIERNLLSLASHEIGLAVSDNIVREEIQNLPAFQNEVGQFDRFKFNQVLQTSNLTEGMLVEQLRGDLNRGMLVDSLRGAMIAPRTLVEPAFTHREERRIAQTLLVANDKAGEIAPPDDSTIKTYHEQNAGRFTAPEYRKLTFVSLKAEDLAGNVAVSEDRVVELFQERSGTYNIPERRKLSQAVLPDEAAAKALVESANAGGELTGAVDLGVMDKSGLPLPELADVAFSLSKGQVGGPVKSPFGWHVFKVEDIEAARTKTLDEAREELTRDIALELAVDDLYKLSNDLEDTLGGGATLEEAARDLSISIATVAAVDAQGRDTEGGSVEGLAADPDFLRVAFATEPGQESALTEFGSDGYFIVRIDSVTPPTLRPLDSVRNDVIKAWTAERKSTAALDRAKSLAKQMESGLSLDDAAKAVDTTPITTPALTRDGTGAALPRPLVDALFNAEKGAVVTAQGPAGAYVARLTEIIVPNAKADSEKGKVAALTTAVTQEMSSDLMVQYLNALRSQYGVTVNQRALDEAQ
ncbi:SurA N-terminal domain-containing protein [Magnetospira sp. QH-2]|uniref:SurA N-terminal domain-containing protein n=1 Tax=Magnetospira sp. (strain QH-2) TaxID=1288970 RepID=UPI0003E81382|nr:SurA N-terminal domain-containing protein [Magnetospira sp. QH-2]CCQ73955.1 Putative peptidyl-prolyl cis-trans isomerse [Magnetospira sp. QH-2]